MPSFPSRRIERIEIFPFFHSSFLPFLPSFLSFQSPCLLIFPLPFLPVYASQETCATPVLEPRHQRNSIAIAEFTVAEESVINREGCAGDER